MKKLKYLTTLIASLTIILSCSDEDNLSQNLIGKWTLKSRKVVYSKGEVKYSTLSECEKKFTYEFVDSKNIIGTEYKGDNCETPKIRNGNYSFNNNTKILIWPNGKKYLVSFESNLLLLQTNYEAPIDFDGDDIGEKSFIVLER